MSVRLRKAMFSYRRNSEIHIKEYNKQLQEGKRTAEEKKEFFLNYWIGLEKEYPNFGRKHPAPILPNHKERRKLKKLANKN